MVCACRPLNLCAHWQWMPGKADAKKGGWQSRLGGIFTWTPEWSNARFVATCLLALAIAIGIGVAVGLPLAHAALYMIDMMKLHGASDSEILMLFMLSWLILIISTFCLGRR